PGPTPPANGSARPAKPAAASDQGADELKPVVIQPQEKKAPTWRGVAERDSGATANRPAVAPPAPATDATTQQLISQLVQLDISRGALTAEQTKTLGENIKRLAAQGATAVPAIREFLARNQDLNFEGGKVGNLA